MFPLIPSPALRKAILFPAALLLMLTASPLAALAGPVEIIDDTGEAVRLERPARRIIALYGAFNEILAAMSMEDRLIARTLADDLPPSILDKPSIGTHMRPNLEMIVGLEPDLVLQMVGRKEAAQATLALKEFGVKTATFAIEDFEDLFSVVERIGVLTAGEDSAAALVADMQNRLDAVFIAVAPAAQCPRVFFEVRYPNLLAAGKASIVSDIVRRAGAVNCVDTDKKLVRLNEEELVRLDPDVYLLQQGPMNPDPSPPSQRPHFQILQAVRTDHVFLVDQKMFSRPGPRNIEAVELLARLLHPDRFPPGPAAPPYR